MNYSNERLNMANICSVNMSITGPEEELSKLANKIDKKSPALIRLFPWMEKTTDDYGLWEDTYNYNEKHINFSFGCKWNFPDNEFGELARKYKKLSFKGTYEEPGMCIFGKFSAEEGSIAVTDMEGFDYFCLTDPDFAEMVKKIRDTLPYKKVIRYIQKYFEEKDDDDTYNLRYLESVMLERIQKKDLPLFIHCDWDDVKTFTETLKGE